MEIKKVGVMGCGAMGLGVAQVCAQAGIPTVAVKATPGSTDKIRAGLDKSLGKMVERGKMTTEQKDSTLGLLQLTNKEEDVAGCDLIIESIIEDLETKKALFQRLEGIVSPEALLTTNTSTLSVTALMAVCKHRERVAGLHFFNPATVMKLVEIIHAFETSDATIGTLNEFCKKLKKDPVIVQDTTGFIVNRLLTPYMLSAIRLLEMGTGTIADIDHAMKSGAGHPMGPFELADYIGLDVVEAMTMNIYQDMHQPHVSPPIP
jgi:3-hydroxybutyryl-CoA dehydrogenase